MGDWTSVFIEVAKENVTPPYVQDLWLSGTQNVPTADGVDKIREALLAGMAAGRGPDQDAIHRCSEVPHRARPLQTIRPPRKR